MPSNGGYLQPLGVELIPANVGAAGAMYYYITSNFNDPNEMSFYYFKVEDVIAGRTPTCNFQAISYRDLGVATIMTIFYGTNDAGNVLSKQDTFQIGTVGASGRICTINRRLAFTGQNLQFGILRAPNAGPVSITKVRLEGRIEKTSYS